MNLRLCHIAFFVLVSVAAPGCCQKNGKIKIIVPQKINYVHYHPHPLARISSGLKPFYMEQQGELNSYEDEAEEGGDGDYQDEEYEGSDRGNIYYAKSKSRFSHSDGDVGMKPVFLYNSPVNNNKFKYPTTYAIVRYSD